MTTPSLDLEAVFQKYEVLLRRRGQNLQEVTQAEAPGLVDNLAADLYAQGQQLQKEAARLRHDANTLGQHLAAVPASARILNIINRRRTVA